METFSISEVKKNFSKMVTKAARGEPFVVSINGKPLVKFSACDPQKDEIIESPGADALRPS